MGCGGKTNTSVGNGAARRHLRRTRKKTCRYWCRAVLPEPQNDHKPRPVSRHVASSVLNRNGMSVASRFRPGRASVADGSFEADGKGLTPKAIGPDTPDRKSGPTGYLRRVATGRRQHQGRQLNQVLPRNDGQSTCDLIATSNIKWGRKTIR